MTVKEIDTLIDVITIQREMTFSLAGISNMLAASYFDRLTVAIRTLQEMRLNIILSEKEHSQSGDLRVSEIAEIFGLKSEGKPVDPSP